MNFDLEIKKLKELNWPQSDFVVVGSRALTIKKIGAYKPVFKFKIVLQAD